MEYLPVGSSGRWMCQGKVPKDMSKLMSRIDWLTDLSVDRDAQSGVPDESIA